MHKTDDEAIKNAMPPDGGFISFDGQNCIDPCSGWNGTARRCECGNRRVSWQCYQDDDGWHASAEAY